MPEENQVRSGAAPESKTRWAVAAQRKRVSYLDPGGEPVKEPSVRRVSRSRGGEKGEREGEGRKDGGSDGVKRARADL